MKGWRRRGASARSGRAPAPVLVAALTLALVPRPSPGQAPRPDLLRAHTEVLAHDSLGGRGTASRGGASAAAYIASQLRSLGLDPLPSWTEARSGDRSRDLAEYLLPVPLVAHHVDTSRASLRIASDSHTHTLRHPAFYPPGGRSSAMRDFTGDLILAGPTPGALDALAGVPDLTGLVVVLGPPWTGLEDVEAELHRRGAAGVIEAVPSSFYHHLRVVRGPVRYSLAGDIGAPAPPRVVIGPEGIAALGLEREITPPGTDPQDLDAARTLGLRVDVRLAISTQRRTGHNVAAVLAGPDTAGDGELLLFIAHYDGVGYGELERGDSVWNGFVDNAAGVAVLLELARTMAADPRPGSVAFLFTTAEEQGLLGATRFVHQPPVALESIRAVVNIDGGAPPADIRAWNVAGPAGDLRDRATAALEDAGWSATARPLVPDSDHWAFHRAGVPAMFLYPDQQAPDTHPHTPDDEWRAGFPFEGLARYAAAALAVRRALARGP